MVKTYKGCFAAVFIFIDFLALAAVLPYYPGAGAVLHSGSDHTPVQYLLHCL